MTKKEMLLKIKENMYWESMFAYVWKDNEQDYHVEINKEDVTITDEESYIGKVNLSEWYWNSTDDFDIKSNDDYILECIADAIS